MGWWKTWETRLLHDRFTLATATQLSKALQCSVQVVSTTLQGRWRRREALSMHSSPAAVPKKDTQSRMKKSPFILKVQRAKNNQPDFPWKQNNNQIKQKTKITQTYWNQHYRLHIKHAQENVQWELILYIESVSSALQHFCSTQRVLICPGWDSDVTHQNRLFGFHAELIFPQQQRQELLFCSDLRPH